MKGLDVDVAAGKIEFVNGARTVSSTNGTLVCLLPTVQTFAPTLSFPDVSKDICYLWTASRVDISGTTQEAESCACFITARPQEYSNDTVLMAVPAGADFFIGRIRLNRTNSPSHNWMGRALSVLPPQNLWMSIPGSFSALVESEINIARGVHVFITGGNLVMRAEQSIGPAPGGYGNFPQLTDSLNYKHGGSFTNLGNAGTPVYLRDQKSRGYTTGGTILGALPTTFQRTGTNPCATSDPTDYSTDYSVDITGRFGRRS